MFNYTNMNSSQFEKLALRYLQDQYPGSTWKPTKGSWDGNKDIQNKYTFFNQTMEYWAEAKFTPNPGNRSLQKSQLDPTLVSAFLNRNPVTINFISNNNIPENYIYRLTDFKLKTNIGIVLVLKEEFEQWLLANPDICEECNLVRKKTIYDEEVLERCVIRHCLITEEDFDYMQYSFTKSLNYSNAYFLYLNIYASKSYPACHLNSNIFKFVNRSSILEDAQDFDINEGLNGYKFEFIADRVYDGNVNFTVRQNKKELAKYEISNVKVIEDSTLIVSYGKQEKALTDICTYIQQSGEENNLVIIRGTGATGKSYLLGQVHKDLESRFDIFHIKFNSNNSFNAECLCRLLIYLNLGKIWEFDLGIVSDELKKYSSPMQYLLYENLISGLNGKAEEAIEYINKQLSNSEFQLLFPTQAAIRKVSILDDFHKLKRKHLQILERIIEQCMNYNGSQTLILASRGQVLSGIKDSSKSYYIDLVGLSKDDKDATLEYYLGDNFDITYNRATDDVLIFTNIVHSLLEDKSETEFISKNVNIIKKMSNPQFTNLNMYKSILNEYKEHFQIIELVYYIGSGIETDRLCIYFEEEEINFLVDERIFKKKRNIIYPFHDLLIQAYFEIRKVSKKTIKTIKKMLDNKCADEIYYLSLILSSDYGSDFFIEARNHRNSYYQKSELFPAYQISQGLVNNINFDEDITKEELEDLFIFAETSMYEKEHSEVQNLYDKIIRHGKKYIKKDEFLAGLVLRSYIEKVNIQFWNFQTKNIITNIENIQSILSDIVFKTNNIDFTYIHCLNRTMVTQLLMNQMDCAEKTFKQCILEAETLNYQEHIGFAYMDFGRGTYSIDIERSISYLESAMNIFKTLNSEQRREMECEAEFLYANCICSPSQTLLRRLTDFSELLFDKHYFEIYSKVKLKIAALKLVYDLSDLQDIQDDIFRAEYAMKYQPSVRYQLVLLSVKSAYYFKIGDLKTAHILNDKCMKLARNIGNHYQLIYAQNNKDISKPEIKFMMGNKIDVNVYYLTPYLW